jgi:hypothetical protein
MTNEKICPIMSRPIPVSQFRDVNFHDAKLIQIACLKERCEAWVPERTEFVKGDPRYSGRPDKNLVYPAHCLLISPHETLWPTVHALSGNDETG